MHANSILIFEKYAKQYFRRNIKVLEIGPDKFPSSYKEIINDNSIKWDTLDIFEDNRLTYNIKDEYSYPIANNTYDIVLSGNVLEHVRKIWIWIKELTRVCKKGGVVITINPLFLEYHPYPVDCWRAFPDGMRVLYDEAGLNTILSVSETLDVYNPKFTLGYLNSMSHKLKFIGRMLLKKLRFPIERIYVYDTITIGVK